MDARFITLFLSILLIIIIVMINTIHYAVKYDTVFVVTTHTIDKRFYVTVGGLDGGYSIRSL